MRVSDCGFRIDDPRPKSEIRNPKSEEDLPRKLLWLEALRVSLITVLLGGILVAVARAGGIEHVAGARPLLAAVACAYLATAVSILAMRHVRRWTRFTYGQLALDLAVWASIVYATGGPGGYFVYPLHMVVLLAAVYLGVPGTASFGAAAALLYAAMSAGLHQGWLPWPPGFEPATPAEAEAALSAGRLAPDLASILGVAALAGFLAHRTQLAGRGLAAAERARADLTVRGEFILGSLPIGVLTTDLAGSIRSANPEACRLAGRSSEMLNGASARVVLGLPAVPEPVPAEAGDLLLRRPDGTDCPLEYSTSILRDSGGEPIGALWILRDVSEMVTIRSELDRVERLSALGKLAVSLAHEIRNPLGAIRGAVELLRRPDEDPESARLAATVVREVDRINDLVGQMLGLAKPQPLEPRPVVLRHLIDDVLTLARQDARSTRVRLGSEVAAGTPDLHADPAQLRQALWNLVKNAMQAAPPGGSVRISAEAAEGGALLCVDDSGPGVPVEDRERVFDMFYTGKAFGVGIGLAVCRQAVASHGGRVWVGDSNLGGASFRIFLPAARPSTPLPPRPGGAAD